MNDDLTTRLRDQLHEQVDGWHSAPLTFESVRGRAHGIRRTRRMAAAGVAAVAVVAVALPIGLLGDPAGRSDAPPEIANTPTQAADTSELLVPFVSGRTLTMPDGTEQQLPRNGYRSVAVLGGTVLAVRVDGNGGTTTLDRIEGGEVTGSEELRTSTLAYNAEGTSVAYVRADGELVVESEEDRAGLGYHGALEPVRLFGTGVCGAEDGPCLVFADQGTPKAIGGPDDVTELPGDPLAVLDASAAVGRVALLTSVDDREPGSCSAVVSNNSVEGDVFETCDVTLSRFSASGRHLSAGPAYQSGAGNAFAAIIDGETGKEVARFEPEDGHTWGSVWEDGTHLLIPTFDSASGTWRVVRLGLDGETETVLGPVEGDGLEPPWQLVGAF